MSFTFPPQDQQKLVILPTHSKRAIAIIMVKTYSDIAPAFWQGRIETDLVEVARLQKEGWKHHVPRLGELKRLKALGGKGDYIGWKDEFNFKFSKKRRDQNEFRSAKV